MEDLTLMKYACDLANYSVSKGCGPFGCIITTKDKKIIGKGHNKVVLNNDPTAHAEIVAIRDACNELDTFNLEDCILYTSCEPCPMCLSAIYWARIKTVYYGNSKTDAKNIGFDDEFIYDELNKPIDERQIKLIKINIENIKDAFVSWSEKLNKIKY